MPKEPRGVVTVRHGHYLGYITDGCRCPECTRAWRMYHKLRIIDHDRGTPRRIDNTGSLRRVRALQTLGWPTGAIADAAGCHQGVIANLARCRTIGRDFAARIAAAYERLRDHVPPPATHRAAVAHALRISAGHPGPDRWDDGDGIHGIDNPQSQPRVDPNTTAARRAAIIEDVRDLVEAGEHPAHIAARVGKPSVAALAIFLRRHAPDLAPHFYASEKECRHAS